MVESNSTQEGRGRLPQLDSLSGLAALCVVLFHFKRTWIDVAMPNHSSLSVKLFYYLTLPFTCGREAVILFFILSGFVLSIPAVESRAQTYGVFVVRRIFRIYFPYLVFLLVAILGDLAFQGKAINLPTLKDTWSGPIDWRLVGQHVLFLGSFDTSKFDPPIWSLVDEMRISLVFPLLCAMTLRLKTFTSLCVAGLLTLVSVIAVNLTHHGSQFFMAVNTVHYAGMFILGINLVRESESISKIYNRLSRGGRIAVGLVAYLIFADGQQILGSIVEAYFHRELTIEGEWVTALGAAGLICISLNSKSLQRVLLWPPIHNLGKMSYSVYLLHYLVLMAALHLFFERIPLLPIFAICLVATLAVSWVSYRAVEVPFINLGRKLSGPA